MNSESNLTENVDRDRRESDTDGKLLADTPVMREADFEQSAALSLKSTQPPVSVPGYEQEQFLGRGAFGEVWKAVDSNSGRVVAIKYFSHRGGLDWSHMTREVEKLQYLFSDRYVVQLFDVGWDADPPYYVMEYMAYGSLEDRLRKGPMTVSESVKMIREIAVGLAHAHDKGVLHCDLKPGNIMLDQDGRPRLADFGQARLKHEHAPALGTLFYMAPEQADLSATPDARWDVYALGAILYRMITGELPYLNDEISEQISSQESLEERLEIYSKLATEEATPSAHRLNADVDNTLSDLIDACLDADPSHRHPNVESVLNALDLRESRKSQRPMLLLGLVGPTLVVLLIALLGTFLFQKTIETASEHLLERTGESNQFAARSVADRFALEVDKRWRILEQEVAFPRLREWLKSGTDETQQELQRWLEQRHAFWNDQFTSKTAATYWYILDSKGNLRAVTPLTEKVKPHVGENFGYREYFHGLGRQLREDDPVPKPISAPHRSNVFRSKPDNNFAVTFSVPIPGESTESDGILAMETDMGSFAEFQGSRNQLSVLVDLRIDEEGRAGLIVEHPKLDEMPQDSRQSKYLADDQLNDIRQIARPRSGNDGVGGLPTDHTIADYRDPMSDPSASEHWIASVAPVRVIRGDGKVTDTDWAIIVQEETEQTLMPLKSLGRLFIRSGLAALALAVLIIGGLWWIVMTVANAPGRLRSLGLRGRTATLHSQTGATSSMFGAQATPQNNSHRD